MAGAQGHHPTSAGPFPRLAAWGSPRTRPRLPGGEVGLGGRGLRMRPSVPRPWEAQLAELDAEAGQGGILSPGARRRGLGMGPELPQFLLHAQGAPDTMALVSADSRIAELLTELHQLIKQTQEERSRSEHNLVNIQKTHERMQTENKISPYYRTKLRGLYTTAKADAEAECK
ncbi:SAGA-associated factor 29 isoform X1 [Rhinolophus ferrumequinum]|uniref:SAGA-associated factor 29 isoform X1 n=1 Tax=Rhinolophus ferrumequinum TaxID=59479 RepID=UPI00140FE617|nr:SAGA-associated factor 29 isoform X1 [Rhinolophus ferrumequinum]